MTYGLNRLGMIFKLRFLEPTKILDFRWPVEGPMLILFILSPQVISLQDPWTTSSSHSLLCFSLEKIVLPAEHISHVARVFKIVESFRQSIQNFYLPDNLKTLHGANTLEKTISSHRNYFSNIRNKSRCLKDDVLWLEIFKHFQRFPLKCAQNK